MSTAQAAPASAPAPASDPVQVRRERGLAIAAVTRITRAKGREERWIVPSQTGRRNYTVSMVGTEPECDCADFGERGGKCKHIFAVEFVSGREKPPTPLERPRTESERISLPLRACAPRPTYKQNWPAYVAAQVHEKEKFQSLLAELCAGIAEPPRPHGGKKGGRPPIPMADRVFAAAFKVYSTFSTRRASSDMRDARDKGHLSRAPHYSRIIRFLEDPAMTPILMALIGESARPLSSIESDFCVDSSGFATSRFVRWYDHKYGVIKQEYDWVKVSVCTGKTTNIITAVEIDERYASDYPKFIPLVNATAKNFTIREVSADAAYLSYENMEIVASHGGTPYIAFRSSTSAKKGGTLGRMFHLYNFNREEYLSHYHKRSNVESTFSMIKAKFGDSLRSKTDAAMVNEALAKVLCHNLVCLIQSAYELGVVARFWSGDEVEPVHVAIADDMAESLAWI